MARGRGRQHPRLRAPLPRRGGGKARAELPEPGAHPGRGQRGDRPEPGGPARKDPRRGARRRAEGARALALPDAGQEAKFVVREIRALLEEGLAGRRLGPEHIAVLYRSNAQAKLLEEELRVGGVPYRVYGGTQFFDRKEVKDLVAYLRVVAHRRDDLSLRRAVNTPARGVGIGSLDRLRQHALAERITLEEAFRRADGLEGVSEPARRGLRSFLGAID
ncbi:MAG: 3'-5' exonuclease, partial [Myxococcota bacterium]